MKLSLSLVITCAANAAAFQGISRPSVSTKLFAEQRADAAAAIQAAQEAAEKYGASSPEARLAWEAVEEMDAAQTIPTDNDKKYTPEQTAKMYTEFQANLKSAQRFAEGLKLKQVHMSEVINEMMNIKLSSPESQPSVKSPKLDKALQEARKAGEEFGYGSPEAKLAYETVEEIAAAGLENAMGDNLMEECLLDVAEACIALEEAERFINLERIKDIGLSNF